MPPTTGQPLESLYVTIDVDQAPFLKAAGDVERGLDSLEAKFVNFGRNVSAAFSGGMESVGRSLGNIGRFIDSIESLSSLDKIGLTVKPLKKFSEGFRDFATGFKTTDLSGMRDVALSLSRVGGFMSNLRKFEFDPDQFKGLASGVKFLFRSLNSAAAGTDFSATAKSLGDLGKFITSIQGLQDVDKIKNVATPLNEFTASFKTAVDGFKGVDLAPMSQVATMLGRIGNFMRSATNFSFDPKRIMSLSGTLQTLFGSLAATAGNVNFDVASKTVGRFSTFMSGLGKFDASSFTKLGDPLKNFFSNIASLNSGQVDRAGVIGSVISRMANGLGRLSKAPAGAAKTASGYIPDILSNLSGGLFGNNFAGIDATAKVINRMSKALGDLHTKTFAIQASVNATAGIKTLMSNLAAGAGNVTAVGDTASLLGKMARTIDRFSKANYGGMVNVSTAAANTMAMLNKMTVGPNVNAVLKALSQFATVMRRMGIAGTVPGGGAGQPPVPPGFNITGNTFGGAGGGAGQPPAARGMSQVASSAKRAQTNVSDLGREMRSFSSASDRLVGALTSVHMAMVTIATFSLRQFAQQDDALTRAYANMVSREGTPGFEQSTKPEVQSRLMDLSGKTRTGMVDLAKGFDLLASSGMSAGMAVDAVTQAESFALAGGMKMEDATRRLVDIQRIMGLNLVNPIEHLKEMQRISDVLAGTAPRVGSTVQELANAFTGKLAVAANQANMNLNDTVAVLGVMSQQGFRGSAGGDLTSRLLMSIGKSRSGFETKWKNLLGNDIYDETGKMMDMSVVADRLTKTLGTMGDKRRMAFLGQTPGLGFDARTIPGILALVGQGDNIRKRREDVGGMAGVAEKMADVMRRSFMGQMTTLYNSAMNLAAVLGERLAPMIFALTEPVRLAVNWFTKLNPALQQLAVVGAIAAVGFGPLVAGLRYVFSIALTPFRMIGAAVSGVVGAVGSVVSFVSSSLQAVYNVGHAVVSAFAAVGSAVYSIVTGLGSAVYNTVSMVGVGVYHLFAFVVRVGDFMLSLGGTLKSLFDTVVIGVVSVMAKLTAAVVSMAASFLTGLLTIGTTLLATFIALPFIITVVASAVAVLGAAIAAVGVTVGIGLAQFAAVLGAGIVAVWAGFKAAVAGVFWWTMERFDHLQTSAAGVWESFKGNAVKAMAVVGDALHKLAGFFWNFKQNIKVIGEWWTENWRDALIDIGSFAEAFVENMGNNIYKTFAVFGYVAGTAISGVWGMITRYFTVGFGWLSANWDNIWSDAATVFSTFIKNLSANFMSLLPVIDAIAQYIGNRMKDFALGQDPIVAAKSKERDLTRIRLQSALLQGDVVTATAEQAKIPKAYRTTADNFDPDNLPKFKGPMEGLPELKTNFASSAGTGPSLMNLLGRVTKTNYTTAMPAMFASMKDMIGDLADDIASPLKGFTASPIWAELYKKLNLNLPPDAMSSLLSSFVGPLRPANEPGQGGDMLGKGGPGFVFKQSSMARTEVGGEFQQNLEYQQLSVLQAIRKDIGVIADAMSSRGGATTLKMPRPMKEGD